MLLGRVRAYSGILWFQCLGIMAGFVLLSVYPPARGAITLYPLTHDARIGMLALAVRQNARLIGPGPLPGSFVVFGDRAALAGPMARHRILTLAGARAACSSAARRAS